MNTLTTFARTTPEYARLVNVAEILTATSAKGLTYSVEDCYFDFGQNWMFTTIIAHDFDGSSWQALCPRNQEVALTAPTALKAVNEITSFKYWTDK